MAHGPDPALSACVERFVETRFGPVRCLLPNEGLAPAPVAFLVHGVGARAEVWAPVLQLLRGVRAIAIDLPGHGGSSGPLLASAEAYAHALGDVRSALGLESIFAIGQSLGGAVVQCYARDHAATCRGIVIAHSAAYFAIAQERIRQLIDDWPAAMSNFAARQVSSGAGDALKEEARRVVSLRDPVVLAHDLLTCNAFDARPWAASVRTPVLVLTGDEDTAYGPDRARELQALYAGSRLVVLPSCGHNGVLERPAAFATAIDDFVRTSCPGLDRLSPNGRSA